MGCAIGRTSTNRTRLSHCAAIEKERARCVTFTTRRRLYVGSLARYMVCQVYVCVFVFNEGLCVCVYVLYFIVKRTTSARRSYHITFKMRLRLPGKELLMVS